MSKANDTVNLPARAQRELEKADASWLTRPERGKMLGIRAIFAMATMFGRWPARQFVRMVSFYYWAFDRETRRVSRDWLRRVLDRTPTWRDTLRHVQTFAQVSLDRIFLLKDRTRAFEVNRTGDHHLAKLKAEGRGAVLLGAHLGSFESMRVGAEEDEVSLNIVGHFENARMVNYLFDRLDPDMRAQVIDVGEDPIGSTLKVRESVEEGALVAILGDRVGINKRTVEVKFFGERASFPAGPFLLAATLRCPIYLVFGLYYEPNRYELFCEPFAESLHLPRSTRQEALEEAVQRYASRLEHYARRAPFNWFNFYDFWDTDDA